MGGAIRKELEMYRLKLPMSKYHKIINTVTDTTDKSVPSTCGFPVIMWSCLFLVGARGADNRINLLPNLGQMPKPVHPQ